MTEADLNLHHKIPGTRRALLVRVFLIRRRAVPTLSMRLHITTMLDRISGRGGTTHGTLVVLMCAQEVPRPGEEEHGSGDGSGLATSISVYQNDRRIRVEDVRCGHT